MMTKEAFSHNDILGYLYCQLKNGMKKITGTQKKTSGPCGKRFLTVVSCLQLALGVVSICCAALGIGATFEVRAADTFHAAQDILDNMHNKYRGYAAESIEEKLQSKYKLVQSCSLRIRYMQRNNCTISQDLPSMDDPEHRSIDHVNSWNDFRSIAWRQVPQYCQGDEYGVYSCLKAETDKWLEWRHLILEYLSIPAWTGLMLIITSVVGFRAVSNWTQTEGVYFQVERSHVILNILCLLLFGPAMMFAACKQISLADGTTPFRAAVGRVTGVFAGLVLLLSLVVAIVNCCRLHMVTNIQEPAEDEKEKKKPVGDNPVIVA